MKGRCPIKKVILLCLVFAFCLPILVACSDEGTTEPEHSTSSNTSTTTPSGKDLQITHLEKAGVVYENIMAVTASPYEKSYQNPLITPDTPNAWENYGVGDPFVMRFNGRYYLYCSTKDGECGIQCWTSDDLVAWRYGGLCATEMLTVSAYAPEVVYWNGCFYMYTSPAGNGHYVLKSSSPTGPFVAVTDNFGLSIDGDVFIDDDGKWYFYSADGAGIMVYTMTAPDHISSTGRTIGASMNGWTEGSMIVKNGDIYYLTYTGNHVWSNGYRINYATSAISPMSFTAASDNPLIVNTLSSPTGIGHSSTVMGPNMDSYYLVYHSSLGAPRRQMNIDRLVFNGTTMEVLGPTVDAIEAPQMPDIYTYFEKEADLDAFYTENAEISSGTLAVSDGGRVVSRYSVGDNFTAECNILSISGGKAGMIFSYLNEQNFGKALFDPEAQTLEITLTIDGKATTTTKALVNSFDTPTDFSVLQALMIKKDGEVYTFFVNNRKLTDITAHLAGGAFGVTAECGSASFGFTAITGDVGESSIKSYFKPIPGSLQGITAVESVDTVECNGSSLVKAAKSSYLNYLVSIASTAPHDLAVCYRSETASTVALYQNKKEVATLTLPSTNGEEITAIFRAIPLEKGNAALTLHTEDGIWELSSLTFAASGEVATMEKDFSADDRPTYSDGTWTRSNGELTLGANGYGKRLYGEKAYGDYTVEADITPKSSKINFGLLVRASNPSVGGAGNDVPAGSNFLQGYFIGIDGKSLVLGKHNYNWKTLQAVPFVANAGETYHIKVTVSGATLTVSVNGNEMLTYNDSDPFMQGMVGIRGHGSTASVDNFTVTASD